MMLTCIKNDEDSDFAHLSIVFFSDTNPSVDLCPGWYRHELLNQNLETVFTFISNYWWPYSKAAPRTLDGTMLSSLEQGEQARRAAATPSDSDGAAVVVSPTGVIIDLVDFEQTMSDLDEKVLRFHAPLQYESVNHGDLIVGGPRTFEVINVEDVCNFYYSEDEHHPCGHGDDCDGEVRTLNHGEDQELYHWHKVDEKAILEALPVFELEDEVLHTLIRENRWDECMKVLQQLLLNPQGTLRDRAVLAAGADTSLLHTVSWKAPKRLLLLFMDALETCPIESSVFGSPKERLSALLRSGDGQGNTPLHLVCANLGKTDTFTAVQRMLLAAPRTLEVCNDRGDTPFHLLLASDALQAHDSIEIDQAIASLLEIGRDIPSVQNQRGLLPLHVAIANNCSDVVCCQILEATPSQALACLDQYGMTAVHFCAVFGHSSRHFLREVIQRQPSCLVRQTNAGDTPLHLFVAHLAVDRMEERCLNRLVDALNVLLNEDGGSAALGIRNGQDLTPLHYCALFGAPWELTQTLVNRAPERTALAATKSQSTPLHLAVLSFIDAASSAYLCPSRRELLLMNILTLATPLACEVVDAQGQTALLIAIQSDAVPSKILRRLVDASPSSLQIADPQGFLPVHRACQKRHVRSSIMKGMQLQGALLATSKTYSTGIEALVTRFPIARTKPSKTAAV